MNLPWVYGTLCVELTTINESTPASTITKQHLSICFCRVTLGSGHDNKTSP